MQRQNRYATLLAILLLIACSSRLALGQSSDGPSGDMRTWTSADGNFTLKAEVISQARGSVVLEKEGGQRVTVETKKLSAADRSFLAKIARASSKKKKQKTTPPPEDPTKIKIVEMEIDGATIVPNLQWSANGQEVLALDQSGHLHKLSVLDGRSLDSLDLGGQGSWLSRCSLGLVAALKSTQEFCVVDPESMEIKHRHEASGINKVAGEPSSAVVFVTDGGGRDIYAVDARNGKVTGRVNAAPFHNAPKAWDGIRVNAHPSASGISQFQLIAAVPGGKYVLAADRSGIYKFAVSRRGLSIQEVGPSIASNPRRLEISPDGRFVALPSGGGNRSLAEHPDVGYGTYVYSVENLQKPVVGMTTGNYPRCLAIDPATGWFYAQNYDHHLVVVNDRGVKVAQHRLDNQKDSTRHILAHPEGNQLCVLTDKKLYYVRFESRYD